MNSIPAARPGFLVLESGEVFRGQYVGGPFKAGEVVFNTSHSGYEEMATDPSYLSQILVCTAPQQGNYGVDNEFWESKKFWIHGFICLEIQQSVRDRSWVQRLIENGVPILTGVDTRRLVHLLRGQGTKWGALVEANDEATARSLAIREIENSRLLPSDWTQIATCEKPYELKGNAMRGPRVAVLDFGTKVNILRELQARCSLLKVFPSGTAASEIKKWQPDGILLTNGPGDPAEVKKGTETVRELLGSCFIFGICMGHQVLSLALGATTYKLRFGHRGSNHPIKDTLINKIYVTSQNHGYNVAPESLPEGVRITHINLNDNTVAGIYFSEKKCMSVQFHPESHPGPHESVELFDFFVSQLR